MFAFVLTLTLLNGLALWARSDYVTGKKERKANTVKQEIFGLWMTAAFFLWGCAVLIFHW